MALDIVGTIDAEESLDSALKADFEYLSIDIDIIHDASAKDHFFITIILGNKTL